MNKTVKVDVHDGTATGSMNTDGMDYGDYSITAVFSETTHYRRGSSNTAVLHLVPVNKIHTTMDILKYNTQQDNSLINVRVTADDNRIVKGNVNVTYDKIKQTTITYENVFVPQSAPDIQVQVTAEDGTIPTGQIKMDVNNI